MNGVKGGIVPKSDKVRKLGLWDLLARSSQEMPQTGRIYFRYSLQELAELFP